MNKLKVKLENKRIQSYNLSGDKLISTTTFMYNREPFWIENVEVQLWLNYSGSWFQAETATTNEKGISHITHEYTSLSGINSCLGQAKVIYNGDTHESNYIRFNFS